MKRIIFYISLVCTILSCDTSIKQSKNQDEKSSKDLKGLLFEEVNIDRSNIQFKNTIIEDALVNIINYDYLYNGGGVGVIDINNDGLMDLYFTGNQVGDALYLNKGDLVFEDISTSSGILEYPGWSCGISLEDIDQDGLMDIYISRSGPGNAEDRKNVLFINNGNNTFSEKAAEYGLDYDGNSTQALFHDFDKDGDNDMYLLNHPKEFSGSVELQALMKMKESGEIQSDIYFKQENGKFVDASKEVGITSIGFGLGVMATDMNNDGWTDIYVCNDYDEGDILYINDRNGGFRNDINKIVRHTSNYSMGCDFGDINNDGLQDLFTLDMAFSSHERSKRNMAAMDKQKFYARVQIGWHYQYMHNMLHLNDGMGAYSEIAQLSGVSNTDWSWAALFGDYDNDGWQDLFVTNGYKRDTKDRDYKAKLEKRVQDSEILQIDDVLNSIPQNKFENYIYKNNKDLTFTKINTSWGFEKKVNSNGCAQVDLDNDGDLDMVVSHMDEVSVVYENKAEELNRNWLVLDNSSKEKPVVEIRHNGEKWVREFQRVRGFQSSIDPRIHFGLNEIQSIDTVLVFWEGSTKILTDVQTNQILKLNPDLGDITDMSRIKTNENPWFENAIGETKILFKHEENAFDDYGTDILLPQSMAQFGPHISTGDFNKDGLIDIFVGAASGFSGRFFLQGKDGSFQRLKLQGTDGDLLYEDLGSLIFDYDKDGDNDLLIVSGGEAEKSVPRIYNNKPTGISRAMDVFDSDIKLAGMRAVYSDLDNDGNFEVWLGARWEPGAYLETPQSFVLEFENGKFVDKTDEFCPDFKFCGMITDLKIQDLNQDGLDDLLVVGEWMSPKVFINTNGKLLDKTDQWIPKNLEGWYYSCLVEDFDGNGTMDIALGNLGLNNKFHPTAERPLEAYAGDIDGNGTHDIVLAKYENETLYPVRGKECSTEQMPFVSEKYETFESYAKSDLEQIYTSEKLSELTHKKASQFASGILWNNGNEFEFKTFENQVQFGPIQDMLYVDVNKDGLKDIIFAGNIYNVEVETTRYDGSNGGVLVNKGNGDFQFVSGEITGFNAPGDVRDLEYIQTAAGQELILISNNANYLYVYKLTK